MIRGANSNGNSITATHHNAGKLWGKPFAPGQTGNPNGRPRGVVTFAEHIRRIREHLCCQYQWAAEAALKLDLDPSVTTIGELMALQSLAHGIAGNAAFADECNQRADGKVPQHLDVSAVPIEGFKVEYQRPIPSDDSEHPILPDGGPAAVS